MACVRHVSLVFHQREHSKRDVFDYRKFFPGKKNRLPRRAVADCKNYVGIGRAQLFYNRAVRDVRGLRLPAVDLQSADNLLSVRDDLFIVRVELADECADSFSARCRAIRRHDVTVRLLGHADFLELKIVAGTVSIYPEIKSRLLSC